MKWLFRVIVVWLLLFSLTAGAQATPLQEYDEARDIYDSALACMAAYNNRLGHIGVSRLDQEGWKIQYFDAKGDLADARFIFILKTDPASGEVTALLAIAGTETEKDVKIDLRYSQVPFAGSSFAEFDAKAQEKVADNGVPKVHRGFHQATQVAMAADILEGPGELTIAEHLLTHPAHKLIIAGHSLGGAIATLYGSRLLSLGVKPEQIKIITFGAPAVGNAAFADLVRGRLDLTRVTLSGDQIISILQDAVGGYVQFGRELHWQAPDNIVMHPHRIPVYLNMATKHYYDKRQQAQTAGAVNVPLAREAGHGPRVYVAPVRNLLAPALQAEFPYMKEALWDEYRTLFPGYVLAEGDDSLSASLANAADAGCEWLVTADIEGRPSNKEEGVFFLGLQQVVYRVEDGRTVAMFSSSDSTERATPLGAFLNGVRKMRNEQRIVPAAGVK